MRIVHDTRNLEHRGPFGAVPVGGTVAISIDVLEGSVSGVRMRLWSDTRGERWLDMEPQPIEGGMRYSARLDIDEPELLWYRFLIEMEDGSSQGYGACPGKTGGEGQLAWGEPPSFQLTCYQRRATRPEWYERGLAYQIFPDRFARGADWRERAEAALSGTRNGPERGLVEDWDSQPRYLRNPDGTMQRWEFYGGTLSGIREKLGYLHDLGVTVIYLNPIFEAASCHRYDTGDYEKIDALLGDDEEFRRLCEAAAEQGISIILDGVFNHTGCDSRYFNRYGNYPTLGAWQSEDSPYRDWYIFNDDGTYACWWGVTDLPAANEDNPDYQKLIFGGGDAVVRRWLKEGARGWRLDVADELSEPFLQGIHKAALDTRDDAVVLGEVWEDASNKISYGKLRHYLLGSELDSAMNYPLRDGLLGYLTGGVSATDLADSLMSLYENYPHDAFYETLNLLGSHDRTRLLTVLGGAPDPNTLDDAAKASFRLDDGARGLAKARLWLATLVQMTMPGVPCIYYGDEAGLEGYPDPYNRAPYPWGHEDRDTMTIYRNAICLRRLMPHFVDGDFEAFACGDEVFGLTRRASTRPEQDEARAVTVVVNRGFGDHEVEIDALGEVASDAVGGTNIDIDGDKARLTLHPLGSAVVVFRDPHELERTMEPGSGVLCHITSLPNGGAPGNIGAPARRFVDFLERAHQRYWQVLPVNPTDQFSSPYAGISAFAGNVRLLGGADDGLAALLAGWQDTPETRAAYQDFCESEAAWLRPYAAFMAIRELMGGMAWQKWPRRWRDFDPKILDAPELAEGMERHMRAQYLFEKAWLELKGYANDHGIEIIGDMPMYVSADSSDVWCHRELFELGPDGRPAEITGMPPDGFSANGQRWGNPTYDWDAMRADGFDWWVRRFGRAMHLYDYVRLDHFLGFANYYSIEEDKPASEGRWRFGPGRELFETAHEKLGDLPFLAEDLGIITPGVRMLVDTCGFAGMDVVQFSDYDPRGGYIPKPAKVAYSSTHDTDTLLGWCESSFGADGAKETAVRIMASMEDSAAGVVMIALQDAMQLGSDTRMNTPGTNRGNWRWQAKEEDLPAAEELLRDITDAAARR